MGGGGVSWCCDLAPLPLLSHTEKLANKELISGITKKANEPEQEKYAKVQRQMVASQIKLWPLP